MKNRHFDADILIAGGGTPGLALASLLSSAGVRVIVVDPAPQSTKKSTDSRTSALMVGSIDLLQKTGSWESCKDQGGIMRALKIIDDSKEPPIEALFRAEEINQDIFGFNIPNAVLRDSLAENANGFVFHQGAALQSFASDEFGVSAQIDGAPDCRIRLIVGADGRNSVVRCTAGIQIKEQDHKQKAITCLISHTKPHEETSTEFHRSSGPFTLVPLPGNRSSVVWVDFNESIESCLRLDHSAFVKTLQQKTKNCLGTITLETPPQAWPLRSLQATRLVARRTALIAEAAHVLHPLGAQGLNLSLRDVGALADILIDHISLGLDPGSQTVLARYESRRKQDITARVFGTNTLNKMVSNPTDGLKNIRRLGLRTLDNFSLLKEIAMRHGMAA